MKLSLITATHHRVDKFATVALPSVLAQTDRSFEWVVVNDGRDEKTRYLISEVKSKTDITITYLEMNHPELGFGLCHARNLGLEAASGDFVAYLDDDNALAPGFVESVRKFFQHNSTIRCSMVRQRRRRDVTSKGTLVRQGATFYSPGVESSTEDLIQQNQLFDSNGFVHTRSFAPLWNPSYKVFADYEYFLQCLSRWGRKSFKLNPLVLVDYVQSKEGVIGQSNYGEWAKELQQICCSSNEYSVLTQADMAALGQMVEQWNRKHQQGLSLPGFSAK